MECQQSGNNCNTANVLIRIANLGEHGSYDVSYRLSCIEKALEIEEKRHRKESNHRHLDRCFESLWYFLVTENSESKWLEYLDKAMQMLEEINLDSDKLYGHAHLTIGKRLAEQSPNEAERHLRTAEAVLKKTLKDSSHVVLLQINSSLLKIFLQTNRIQDGIELAKQQRRLIDTMLSKSSVPNAEQLCQVVYLGQFYEASGRRNTAKEMYIDVIARLEEQVDPTDSENDYSMLLLWKIQQRVGDIYLTDGMFCDAEAMLQRIASSVKKTTSQRQLAVTAHHDILWNLAAIFTETGRHEQAYELLDSLINMYEKDRKSIHAHTASCAFLVRGELNRRRFRFNIALQDLKKALKIGETFRGMAIHYAFNTQDSEINYAKIMNTIGLIYEQSNNLELAREYYLCCINTVAAIPPTMEAGTFHQNLADTLKKLGRLHDAMVHYKKSLEIREMLHSDDPVREDIATVLYHIAIVQYTHERPKDASETLEKLILLRRELLKKGGSLQNYCAVFVLKGNCHIFEPGEAQQAKDAYEEAEKAFKIMTEGQPNLDYAGALSSLGYACLILNQWEQAFPKLEQALEMKRVIYEEKDKPEADVALACRFLARALFKHQEYQKALPYFQEALEYFEVNQSADDETQCVLHIALCYGGLKNLVSALETFRKVEELCVRKSVSDSIRLGIHKTMADTFTEEEYGDRSKVLYHLKEVEAIFKRIKRSETQEEELIEVQAKILSLEF
ncbi:tetratricopeptide repeat [Paramuricea clavata]|uniref:Tetratricopeptide repeat n=1 Tax=Paramuricea clavata TaxID=317549 RepID=A0A6S7HS54_PARCT|nr:tetratricopeptide repeat [Paramuricea clavata]